MAIILAWLAGGLVVLALLIIALVLFTVWTARRVERLLPPQGRFINVDGTRFHYIDEGSGPALLFIHGLAGQSCNFTHSLLEPLKKDFRVVILDRPGSGYTIRPRGASATLTAQADIIARFIAALGLERPLVIGHSLGGAIALALALDHPEQVGGLALIAPVTHPQDKVPYPFQGLVINSLLLRRCIAWTLATPASIAGSRTGLAAIFGPQAAPLDFATKGGSLLGLRPSNFCNASLDLVTTPEDIQAMVLRYPSLTMPVGVLYGTSDRILDFAVHGEALAAKIAGADLELVEGGGHMIIIASADRCVQFIRRMAQKLAIAANPPAIAITK